MPIWGAQLTDSETTQDALTHCAGDGAARLGIRPVMVDLTACATPPSRCIATCAAARNSKALRVVYLQGEELPPEELNEGSRVLVFRATWARPSCAPPSAPSSRRQPPQGAPPFRRKPSPKIPPHARSDRKRRQLRGRVLLVEDNPVNLMVAQRLIKCSAWTATPPTTAKSPLEQMQAGNLRPGADGLPDAGDGRLHRHPRWRAA